MDKRNKKIVYDRTDRPKHKRIINIFPTVQADFTAIPFKDEVFEMVVFDPPHLHSLGHNSWCAKKYGKLSDNWKSLLLKGFVECFRVLKINSTLIFKWNDTDEPVSKILSLTPQKPLFGHKSGKNSKTHWISFMKTETDLSFLR
jgi:hypothetical protein